ncbi:MAG: GNAT family N-acetyltransferase [Vulcanimicrobiaceae bacterium]
MMVETPRLLIVPLTLEQLEHYVDKDPRFIEALGITSAEREISPELRQRFEDIIISKVRSAKQEHLIFLTIWTIIERTLDRTVGDIAFKGPPNERGEIDIGYGTYPEFRNRGLMTEAVNAMLGWARAREEVRTVTAQSKPDNVASIAVLRKTGFVQGELRDGLLNWRNVLK